MGDGRLSYGLGIRSGPAFYLSGSRQGRQKEETKAVEHLLHPPSSAHVSDSLCSASTVSFRLPSSPPRLVLLASVLQLDLKKVTSKSHCL